MMPVVYAPQMPKKKEKLLLWGFLILGLAAFLASRIPQVLLPLGLQAVGTVSLVLAAMIFTKYVSRRYVYCVEMNEESLATGSPDFTVTEYAGNRLRVVCRISVDEVESVERITRENRARLKRETRECACFDYTGVLFCEDVYLVRLRGSEEHTCLRILANKDLICALSRR